MWKCENSEASFKTKQNSTQDLKLLVSLSEKGMSDGIRRVSSILLHLLLYGLIQLEKGDSQGFLILSFIFGCLVLPGLSGFFFSNSNLHVPPTLLF